MTTRIYKIIALLALLPLFATATVEPLEKVTLLVNSEGEVIGVEEDQQAVTSWNSGRINQNYLDFAHTQRDWTIDVRPGRYRYTITTQANNGKPGRVNLKLKAKFRNASYAAPFVVDRQFAPNRTDNGEFNVADYNSRSNGQTPAGYGKLKIKIGRAAANTNVNYRISIALVTPPQCNYSSLGSDNGTVVGNTRGKYVSSRRACRNNVTVSVTKTGGKAKTIVTVYASDTKNGQGTYVDSYEFAKGNGGGTRSFTVNNANGKYIRVELKNRSAGKTFKWRVSATQ